MKTLTIKYFSLALIAIVFIISGCKKRDWFDVKSDKQLAVPTTLKDMQALLDNASAMNSSTPGLGEVASDSHFVGELVAMAMPANEFNAYTWSNVHRYEKVQDWNNSGANSNGFGSYVRIYYANLVLDGMPKIKPNGVNEQEQWNNIKGQALFHRAHAFYELAQVFVPPYEAIKADIKFGIPLRLESDINIPSKRSTIKQTYDQIINDLIQAKDLLPESPAYKTRPSKQGVYALLARCYLSMENYEQADIYANLCLNSYPTLINYSTLDGTSISNPFIGYNPEIIFYSFMAYYEPIASYNLFIDKHIYDSYDENDLRKKVFFNYDASSQTVNFKGNYSGNGFDNCFSGLATDEIYLIRAECYARSAKVTEAMNDLNTLLKTRWDPNATDPAKPYINIIATDEDDALRKVLAERKKELILRGLRWSDLRRLNRDERFAIKLTRIVNGITYTIEPNSYKYTFPLPDDIIEKTGMAQNEGWK